MIQLIKEEKTTTIKITATTLSIAALLRKKYI
jgi:hypothetical protein